VATFDDVRRIALALPEAEVVLTWETDVTFRVRRKIAGAAYVGRFGWVSVDLDRVETSELEWLVRDAWRLTAPKKLAGS
jgi:hypothetical protein